MPGEGQGPPRAVELLKKNLVEREKRWGGEALDPLNRDAKKHKHAVICIVLKATSNDRGNLAPCHDKFCGSRLDTDDWVTIQTTTAH
ncbi:hypothetical protein TNCV_3147361 [Trichonephila clavipes]|nr:hypothetical protein TNCV_3147361 [Trichonephila clavipes]